MISFVLMLVGKRLAEPRAALVALAALLDADDSEFQAINPPLGYLCFALAALVFILACHCLVLSLRGELELGVAIALPVAECMVGIFAATRVTAPALVLYLLLLGLLRLSQPWRLRRRQLADERKARAMISREPRNQEGYEWLARILADQERPREAAEVLERWLRHEPDNHVVRKKMEMLRAQGRAADQRAIES